MGHSLNRAQILGHIGQDPSISYLGDGKPVAKFTVATSEKWKDGDGETQERTDWHNVICWSKLAEICGQYLHKGSKVYIEGRLQTRSWEDKATGQKKYMTEIVASNVIMLSPKQGGGESEAQIQGSAAAGDDDPLPF